MTDNFEEQVVNVTRHLMFKKDMVAEIIARRKWQTRRLKESRLVAGDLVYLKLNFYTKKIASPAIIKILSVRRETIRPLTQDQVIAESFKKASEFVEKFDSINKDIAEGAMWDVIEFELVAVNPKSDR